MASFEELNARAQRVSHLYDEANVQKFGRPWSPEEIALGFVGDVGDLAKLVQGKTGVRPHPDLDDALAHELADCLWSVMTLAHAYEIDLEAAFIQTMANLEKHLDAKHEGGSEEGQENCR